LAGEDLMTRPVFADINLPLTELRFTNVLLELLWFTEPATVVALLTDLDLEVFDAFVLLALVVTFLGIFYLQF
jgi:hypothetical protein